MLLSMAQRAKERYTTQLSMARRAKEPYKTQEGAALPGGGGLIGGYTVQQFLLLPPGTQQAIASIYGTDATALINYAENQEDVRQFNITNKQDYDLAMENYETAIKVAQIYAGADSAQAQAQVQAAQIQAQAAIEAAGIAAEASRYSDDTKAQIAREANELERQRVAAIEFARPSDWAGRIGYMRGQTPEQAKAIEQYAGGTVFGGQMPGATQGAALPAIQPATAGAAPAAIVGEQGAELAQATPAGVQITPLQQQQAQWLRGKLPQMAGGGYLGAAQESARSVLRPGQVQRNTIPGTAEFARQVEQQRGLREFGLALSDPRTLDLAIEARRQQGGGGAPVNLGIGGTQFPIGSQATPATRVARDAAEAARWAAQTAATAGGTAAGGTATPAAGTAAAGALDQLPFLVAGRAGGQEYVPSFQEWTGERTFPAMGINEPIPTPWEFNLDQWNGLSRAEQAMWAGLWRKAMMIPGETEEEMVANAREAIGRSAFTGMGSALPQYGAW